MPSIKMPYKLIRSRRKSIALLIGPDGLVTVRAPLGVSNDRINKFVEAKSDWISEHRTRAKVRRLSTARAYREGETFLYLGQELKLKISDGGIIQQDGKFLYLPDHAFPAARERLRTWYVRMAEEYIPSRTGYFAKRMGVTPRKVRVNNAKRQWGSCSRPGDITFSWRLMMATPEIIDYVVVHELSHLREHNHSAKYWRVVSNEYPNHILARKWLATNHWRLDLPARSASAE